MIAWTQVSIHVTPGLEELAAEAFCQPPFTGITVEDGRVVTYLSSANDSAATRDELRARLVALGALGVEFAAMPEQEFEKAWRAFRVGRIAIVPRRSSPKLRRSDIPLRLDPGGAFGTGRHGSTRGCLALEQRYVRQGERVLDAGSGSGILAVAAALLGASEVLGFDLAAENGVADRCVFLRCGFDDLPDDATGFDGLLANLYLDLIDGYLPMLRRRIRPEAWFIVSGIRFTERDRVRGLLAAQRFAIEVESRRGKWLTLAGRALP